MDPTLIATVRQALDETEGEYALLPLFVRLLVRRGFVRRTGRDFAAWRALLDRAALGDVDPDLGAALAALEVHYRGAPERARRGKGATAAQLDIIEARSRARADAAGALRAALG